MNRSNLGNQVANGMQVLSVGAFTGGNWKGQQNQRKLADASSALNNMSLDEARQVGRMRAGQLKEEVRAHSNNYDGKYLLTDEEQRAVGQAKATELKENARQVQNKTSGVVNLTDEEQRAVGQAKATELKENARQVQNKTSGIVNLSDAEQQAYGNKKADDLRKYINGSKEDEENKSVDELVSGISSMNTPQSEALAKSINTNSEYLRKRNVGKDPKTGWFVSLNTKKEGDK